VVSVHFVCLSRDQGGALLPHKDGNLSVGSDFVSIFLQDVFEERDCCNMEDLQLSVDWRMQRIELMEKNPYG